MEVLTLPSVVVPVFAVVIAAITDLVRSRVYNALTMPLLVSGVLYSAINGGVNGLAVSLVGTVVGFGLLLLPFLMGGMGGGDVKLLAGIGAWIGVPSILHVFIAAGLMVGVWATGIFLLQKRSPRGEIRKMWLQFTAMRFETANEAWVDRSITQAGPRKSVIHFAVFVALGVIITFVYEAWTGVLLAS
jgi:prepilin peptidase CpaA